MGEEIVIIDLYQDGSVKAKTDGFVGDVCLDAIIKILDGKDVISEIKPDDSFYATISAEQSTKNIQRRE